MASVIDLAKERQRLLTKHRGANYNPMWFHPQGYRAAKCSYRVVDIFIDNGTFLVEIHINRVVQKGNVNKGETMSLVQGKKYRIPISKMGKGFAD